MRKLLIALLAALALPTAVNAESYWLLIYVGSGYATDLEKIEMESLEKCKKQGELFLKEKLRASNKYMCVIGK